MVFEYYNGVGKVCFKINLIRFIGVDKRTEMGGLIDSSNNRKGFK